MESALYLIEANQPVYPLELTRIMRDQRASMIQTPSQYRFVCEAILKVFQEGHIKPLPEFASSPAQSIKSDSCKNVATGVTCKSVISSSSASNHSGADAMSNGSETKNSGLETCGATGTTTVVIDDDIQPVILPVVLEHLGQIDETSPRPESPTSSAESSSAAAPLSTAS